MDPPPPRKAGLFSTAVGNGMGCADKPKATAEENSPPIHKLYILHPRKSQIVSSLVPMELVRCRVCRRLNRVRWGEVEVVEEAGADPYRGCVDCPP